MSTSASTAHETVGLSPLSERPLVSVVIPSFNQGRFIRSTLDSIFSQSYDCIEVLVIDGGSKDETVDVLKSYNRPSLKWVSEPDRGVVDAVNKGMRAAQGEIMAIQSSDDCYTPRTIELIVREFQQRPKVGLIYGNTIKVDALGNELSRSAIGPYSLENLFLIKTWIPQPSAFFRRDMYLAVGEWDETIPYAPDTDLWIRMAFRTEVHKVDAYLSQRRMHDAQRDLQAAKIMRDYSKMIEQSPAIASASVKLRRAAHAGKFLLRGRYNPTQSDWYVAWGLIRAAGLCPETLRIGEILNRLCILPVRRIGSKVKQGLRRMISGSRDSLAST